VFQHTTEAPHRGKGGTEASAIQPLLKSRQLSGIPTEVSAPPFTGRVRNDGMRPGIFAGIAIPIPWVNALKPEVASAGLDEECRDHAATI
jgi:hypothetical protein